MNDWRAEDARRFRRVAIRQPQPCARSAPQILAWLSAEVGDLSAYQRRPLAPQWPSDHSTGISIDL